MLTSAFSPQAIANCLRVGDSGRWGVDLETGKDALINRTISRLDTAPPTLNLGHKNTPNGKARYYAQDFETDLILRATYRRLSKQYSVRPPNRDLMVLGLQEALSEASPFIVTRCDVKGFYENIAARKLNQQIICDTRTDPRIRTILQHLQDTDVIAETSVPRGLALSTLLSEIYLAEFDKTIRRLPNVHRYFRYADDIVVFSLPDKPTLDRISEELAEIGLELNEKTAEVYIKSMKSSQTADPRLESFNFLGYGFKIDNVTKSYQTRAFDVAIAQTKLKKRQSRMHLAFKDFSQNGNTDLLLDRLQFLTSNYSTYKTRHTRGARKQKIRAGIYYNYKHCGQFPSNKSGRTKEPYNAKELAALDAHMNALLFGPNSTYSTAINALPAPIKEQFRRLSYLQGYKKRIDKRFTRARMRQICRIWIND
ncbi:antiviral reverse transcriptase Drt3a [Roseivivax sediminis]|uniref:Reverse transcriptase (RNA-dependent DNA polymerase) n=1 Tax=Roseivivax sediminis TaxID=936889 RepID=A0A1I2DZ22_9RHOB|nr:antiviral reverse transcriptase Drt3a [Roseivivax sediminis]SFE85657.1 Reverse transcriptase (RNA-dependent DNA polymerase) [Roseivivax sediminis]